MEEQIRNLKALCAEKDQQLIILKSELTVLELKVKDFDRYKEQYLYAQNVATNSLDKIQELEMQITESNEQIKVLKDLQKNCIPKPKGLKEAFAFFFQNYPKRTILYLVDYCYHSTLLYLGLLLCYPLTWNMCFGIFVTLRMVRSGIYMDGQKHNKKGGLDEK